MILSIGIASLIIAAALMFFGRPAADGNPARFLRFDAALVLFPSLVLIFTGFGVAAIISSLLK